MPEISRFFGIVIAMYYNDHEPPHFHARYARQNGRFAIETLEMLDGRMSPRVRGLVVEWASLHQEELRREWTLCRQHQPLFAIAPLE